MTENTNPTHLTKLPFSELNLHSDLEKGLAEAGFTFCTPIQAETLPDSLNKVDIAGQAQTGTGKSIAFILATCHHLLKTPVDANSEGKTFPRALILAPTRELAIQIHKDASTVAKFSSLKFALLYGGADYDKQTTDLNNGADIVIGTPGRIIDFLKQKTLSLANIDVFVLDEADRMFDLGFIKDIRYLCRNMPAAEKRLNLLFSATLSYRVMELAYEHMNNPKEIKIESEQIIADKIEEYCFYPAQEEKTTLLVNLLRKEETGKTVVFVNTKYTADLISRTLDGNNIAHAILSGDVPQKKREKLLQRFKDDSCNVLVATDVAARGIHIEDISHVVNYDLPQDADDYVHRIGRTARAGKSGIAINFVCEKYAYSMIDIEEQIGHRLEKRPITNDLLHEIAAATPAQEKPAKQNNKAREKKPGQQRRRVYDHTNYTADYMNTLYQKFKSKPFMQPKQRFSRRFGEVPMIG